MANIYSIFETNEDEEVNGKWFTVVEDFKVKLARAGDANPEYMRLLVKMQKDNPKNPITDELAVSDEVQLELIKELYARAVVKDWEGITDKEGNEIPYSVENCMKLFRELREFYRFVKTASSDYQNYKSTLGNS
jgi:hypothetical protein